MAKYDCSSPPASVVAQHVRAEPKEEAAIVNRALAFAEYMLAQAVTENAFYCADTLEAFGLEVSPECLAALIRSRNYFIAHHL